MTEVSQGLGKLHAVHVAIENVQRELDRGPRRIKAAEKAINKALADQAAQKDIIVELKKASDSKSLQLKTNEARILDLKAKLNAASSNREYEIIKTQIEADTVANSVLEDEILEALEKVDAATARLGEINTELTEARQKQDTVAKEVATKEPELKSKLESLAVDLKEAETVVPTKLKEQYRRLANQKGPESLAPVDKGSCTGCNSMISPNVSVSLNTGEVLFCQTCGRIMFLQE